MTSPLDGLRVEHHLVAAAVSHIGNHRADNQDSAFTAPAGAAVADGVGGGPAGDLASATLVHRFAAGGLQFSDGDELRRRLDVANWDIGRRVGRDAGLRGMATTFTGIVLCGPGILLAHVGDSRAYRLSTEGAFARRTRDDSFVQALVDAGIVSAGDAAAHPRRNVVTATMRGDESDASAITVTAESAHAGDRWLLCSDGVSDYLPDAMIGALLATTGTPRAIADGLVSAALEAGSRDNVTAVVCDVLDGAPADSRQVFEFSGAAAVRFTEQLDCA